MVGGGDFCALAGSVLRMKSHVLAFWILCFCGLLMKRTSGILVRREGAVHDYCNTDNFDVTCGANEVIMMTSALYGRMAIGKCVIHRRMENNKGCQEDALALLHHRCSGHRKCDISVMDPALLNLRPCAPDLAMYLEASFDCIQVAAGTPRPCNKGQGHHLELTDAAGILASEVATETNAGSTVCPWRVKAPPGQTINFTLYNFYYLSPEDSTRGTSSCEHVVTITGDDGNRQRMNGCLNRGRDVTYSSYVTTGNTAMIEFLPEIKAQYLVKYQVQGCADITPPTGMVVKREGLVSTLTCSSGESWKLTCDPIKMQWLGSRGNCSKVTAQPWGIGGIFENEESFPLGILIVVAVGVALGIFLGGTLLLGVSVYMRRRRHLQELRQVQQEDFHVTYPDSQMAEEYYRKPQELSDLTSHHIKDADHTRQMAPAHGGRPAEGYGKYPENRPSLATLPCQVGNNPPKNVQHVYESPNFS